MKWTSETYPTYFYLYLTAEQMQQKLDNSKFFLEKNRGNPWLKYGKSYLLRKIKESFVSLSKQKQEIVEN